MLEHIEVLQTIRFALHMLSRYEEFQSKSPKERDLIYANMNPAERYCVDLRMSQEKRYCADCMNGLAWGDEAVFCMEKNDMAIWYHESEEKPLLMPNFSICDCVCIFQVSKRADVSITQH